MKAIIMPAAQEEMGAVKELFKEYQAYLDMDLDFQGFGEELESLPGNYSLPKGVLLIAEIKSSLIGCVGVRPYMPEIAELKRLFVKPEQQGRGYGKMLLVEAIGMAEQAGYKRIVLDTLITMHSAKALYLSLGFYPIQPYYNNPLTEVEYYAYDF